jgi:hypothetical protein
VTALTSKPTIFFHALESSGAYDDALREELA